MVHRVHPDSNNSDVNNVLLRSDSEIWSMDTYVKIAWEPYCTCIFLDPKTTPMIWNPWERGESLGICTSNGSPQVFLCMIVFENHFFSSTQKYISIIVITMGKQLTEQIHIG